MGRQAMGCESGGETPQARETFILETLSRARAGLAGVALGTQVATLDGLIPVEFLTVGERVVTRSGARPVRAISAMPLVSKLVRVAPGALGHDRPGMPLMLGAGTKVLLRDWRARAMFGAAQALVEITRLIDGQFITRSEGGKCRLYALHFDAPEVIYADGVEIGCEPLRVQAPSAGRAERI